MLASTRSGSATVAACIHSRALRAVCVQMEELLCEAHHLEEKLEQRLEDSNAELAEHQV